MRRFLAYIVMMFTVILAVGFNAQSVLESSSDALEYGKGTQLVYSVTKRDSDDYDSTHYPNFISKIQDLDEADIEGSIMDRLSLAGVRNSEVQIIEGNQNEGYKVKVSFSPLSDTDEANVKLLLSYNGSLSIGTVGDDAVMYLDQAQLFDKDDVAEIVYNGTSPYPSLNIAYTTDMDDLVTEAENAATNHKNDEGYSSSTTTEDGEEATDPNATKLILWQNKTNNDTYDKAYGTNGVVLDADVKSKVVAELDVSNYSADDAMIAITSDISGNAFTVSTARALVNALNSTDYNFDVNFLYQNSVYATFGSESLNLTYLCLGIALLIICLLLIAFYGLSGVTASVNMVANLFLSFIMFNLLGFEFSVAGVIGLSIVTLLSAFISINYFEHVKQESKKGRGPEKANKEGYHKAFFGALDISIVSFFTALFSFLISTGSFKTFFGAIMVGTLVAFILTNFLDKWVTYWLVKDCETYDHPYFFFSKKLKENKKIAIVSSKNNGKRLPIYGIAGLAAVVCALGLSLNAVTMGSGYNLFNKADQYSNGYNLSISFSDLNQSYEALSSKDNYLAYLTQIGANAENPVGNYTMYREGTEAPKSDYPTFSYDYNTAFVNIVEKTNSDDGTTYFVHYFSVDVSDDLTKLMDTTKELSVEDVIINSMENTSYSEDVNGYKYVSPLANSYYIDDSFSAYALSTYAGDMAFDTNNMFLILGLISVFASIYILIRFGLNLFLTGIASGTVLGLLEIGILALAHIPFNSFTGLALMATLFVFNLVLIPLFADNRVTVKERGLKGIATNDDKANIENEVLSKNLNIVLIVSGILIVLFASLFAINESLRFVSLIGIILTIVALFVSYFFATNFYYLCASHITFKPFLDWFNMKRTSHKKNKGGSVVETKITNKDGINYVDPESAHETIIPGLNDFHH